MVLVDKRTGTEYTWVSYLTHGRQKISPYSNSDTKVHKRKSVSGDKRVHIIFNHISSPFLQSCHDAFQSMKELPWLLNLSLPPDCFNLVWLQPRSSCMPDSFYCIRMYGIYVWAMTLISPSGLIRLVGHYVVLTLVFGFYFSSLISFRTMSLASLGCLLFV